MKKNMFYTAALLLAGAVIAACSGSEDIMGDNATEPQAPTEDGAVVLKGTLGSKGSSDNETRAVSSNGVGSWTVGDEFAIYYETVSGHASAVATVNSVNDNGSANFTATLYKPKAGNSEVKLVYPASVHDGQGGIRDDALAEQTGEKADRLDIEKVTTTLSVEEQDGKATTATLNSDVTMEPQVCYFNMTLNKSDGTPLLAKKLEISDGTHNYTVTGSDIKNSIQFEMWPADDADFTFTATVEEINYTKVDVTLGTCGLEHIGCVIGSDGNIYSASKTGNEVTYSASFSNKTLAAGMGYYTTTLKLTPDGTSDDVTPVAMIAYVGSHGSVDDSSTDTETGYHGLAIAMENCIQTNAGADNFINRDGRYSNNTCVWCTQESETCTPKQTTDVTEAREWKNGISMTTYLIEHSTGAHNHYAAKAARAYNVAVPAGCSDWFLPSIGQCDMIARGLVTKQDGLTELYSTAITTTANKKMRYDYWESILKNAGVTQLGGSPSHWSCSESTIDKPWLIYFDGGFVRNVGKKFSNNLRVRSVLAF